MSEQPALQFPTPEDLISQIQFDHENGKIWLDEQRMLLIHSAVMGSLRTELVASLGIERARGFLMRFGYNSGMKDAELAHKVRPEITKSEAFLVGPQLHGIKGMVRVEPVALEFDLPDKQFYAEFNWYDSYEADLHIHEFGVSEDPICWTLLGYASGFSTYYMGHKIIFKETQCAGTGADHCKIVGKPASEWEDQEELERCLLPDPIADELFALRYEVSTLKENFQAHRFPSDEILFNSVGQSEAFKHVCHLIQRASDSTVTVLLQGETGVGKEVVARALHQSSQRSNNPFIAINCACIPPDLIEAELFGVRKGAYTGATESREGKFERANTGTIFLDEVAELSPRAQATLLRVLQEGELERVGDNQLRKIDVRIVAATNENLIDAVKAGKFREDLYYRLNVYPVLIPPLRERSEDISLLVDHFLEKYHAKYNKQTLGVSEKALQALMHYKWPGNIRELENMIERGIILTDNNRSIDMSSFFPSLSEPTHPLNIISKTGELSSLESDDASKDTVIDQLLNHNFDLAHFEQQVLERAMEKADGNITQAARILGITRPQMAYRLKK